MAIPGTEIEFEIEKEDWNIYHLDDRSVLKMGSVLTRIVSAVTQMQVLPQQPQVGPNSQQSLSFNSSFNNIVVVQKAPIGLLGTPEMGPWDFENSEKIEVEFTAFKEEWNVYSLSGVGVPSGFKLRAKLVVSSIVRLVDHHDQLGYPMYFVNSTNAIVPVAPTTPRRR